MEFRLEHDRAQREIGCKFPPEIQVFGSGEVHRNKAGDDFSTGEISNHRHGPNCENGVWLQILAEGSCSLTCAKNIGKPRDQLGAAPL